VVYVCNTRVSHLTQRLDAVFLPATRFHPAAGAGRSCSVLDKQFGNGVRLTFDTGELSVIRKARAVWYGTGRGGKGNLSSDSGVLADTPYSFSTRFESEKGTNPEELIKFDRLARDAEQNCPVSRALKTEITLDAQLVY
jgi:hypothetical protein